MSFVNKFKDLIGVDDYDSYEDDIIEDSRPTEVKKDVHVAKDPVVRENPHAALTRNNDYKTESSNVGMGQRRVPIGGSTSAFRLLVIEPESFDESAKLVDSLKARKPVIINLEKIEDNVAKKIFDFLSGATYALNGNIQKIANYIFIFAPDNVDISAKLNQKGFDFSGEKKNPWD